MAGPDFTPLYVHLSQQVRGQILGGEIAPGEAIPSEAQLMERFRTTRGTVRAAIDILVNEGLVRRVHGKGTFVQLRPVTRSILNFGGLTDSLDGRYFGPIPASSVIGRALPLWTDEEGDGRFVWRAPTH